MRTTLRHLFAIMLVPLSAPGAALLAQEKKSDTLFTVEKFLDLEQVADPQISPDGAQIVYTRRFVNKLEDRFDAALWIMNADGTRNRFLTKGGGARWSPDGTRIAYLNMGDPRGTQVYVRWMDAEGATSQITRVDQNIADIRWSPDGKWIGFSMLVPSENSWHIDMPAAPQGAHWTPAPKYETDLHYRQDRIGFTTRGYLHLFAVSAEGGTPRAITSGEWSVGARFDGQAGAVGWDWSPDGKTIAVAAIDDPKADLVYRNSSILAIDVATGARRRLTSQEGAWNDPVFSPDGRKIAFGGYSNTKASYQAPEVFTMNADGSGVQKLSSLDRDPGNIMWARDGSGVYFNVSEHGTANLYFAPVSGAGAATVTSGTHMLNVSSVARTGMAAGVRSAFGDAPNVVRVDVSKRGAAAGATQLTHVNEDLLSRLKLASEERIVARSTNNTDVEGWIVKPHNFDPSKRYPLILNVHGGPQSQWVDSFRGDWQIYPGAGYIVAFANPHGSTGFGQQFTAEISGDWGGKVFDDLMRVTDALAKLPYVDTTHMGAMGWSFGGYMMNWFEGHTDRFKAIASMMGLYDLRSFYGATEELWFPEWDLKGQPWNSQLYEQLSPSNYVKNFKTPCMVITGERDFRVPYTQGLQMYTALQKMGVPSRLIVYSNAGHWPSWYEMALYYTAHLEWFHQYLGGAAPPWSSRDFLRNAVFDTTTGKRFEPDVKPQP